MKLSQRIGIANSIAKDLYGRVVSQDGSGAIYPESQERRGVAHLGFREDHHVFSRSWTHLSLFDAGVGGIELAMAEETEISDVLASVRLGEH